MKNLLLFIVKFFVFCVNEWKYGINFIIYSVKERIQNERVFDVFQNTLNKMYSSIVEQISLEMDMYHLNVSKGIQYVNNISFFFYVLNFVYMFT